MIEHMGCIDVILRDRKGYTWKKIDNSFFIGYVFGGETLFVKKLEASKSDEEIADILVAANGAYAVIFRHGDEVIACVDRLRGFPLFYYEKNGAIVATDSLTIEDKNCHPLDINTVKLYQCSLFSGGDTTFLQNVKQIEAGTAVKYSGANNKKVIKYWELSYASHPLHDPDETLSALRVSYDELFRNVLKVINGRRVVIPLSGGHDSRMVAYYLCEILHYDNIIAYSYGDRDSKESILSRNVAEIMRIPYYYVDYTTSRRKMLLKELREIVPESCNYTSAICIQEIVALEELKRTGVIDENCVILSGYGGVITGLYVKEKYMRGGDISRNELAQEICRFLYGINYNTLDEMNKVCIDRTINSIGLVNEQYKPQEANEILERAIYREEQSKYIMNAVRVYEHYGMKWITPFFTGSLLDAWMRIDRNMRFRDNALRKLEESLYSEEMLSVPFTGSKEFYKDKETKSVLHHKIDTLCELLSAFFMPNRTHYLQPLLPKRPYYRLFINLQASINLQVKYIMAHYVPEYKFTDGRWR